MSTRIIVHKIYCIFTFTLSIVFFFMYAKNVVATEVRSIAIDPVSPIYNQQFNCALTLDQDDHRNACSLLPLNAPSGTIPWDICTINTVSDDKLTRFYHCIANQTKKVPGPGNYQIVVWNFTGDGETGKVIARKNITILSVPPATPTNIPNPTAIKITEPTETIVTRFPTSVQQITSVPLPTEKTPTIVEFSISGQNNGTASDSSSVRKNNILISFLQNINISSGTVGQWKGQIINGITQITNKTKTTVFLPLNELIKNFMREANF